MLLPALSTFAVGLVITLISSQAFLKIAQDLSARWKVSPLFLSLVIVALGTNLPELSVTFSALKVGDPGLAMANLTGSSIANISLIFGMATLFGSVRIGTTKTQSNSALLLGVVITSLLLLNSTLNFKMYGGVLLAVFLSTLLFQYQQVLRGRKHEDKGLLSMLSKLYHRKKVVPLPIQLAGLTLSIIGLAYGGNVTVDAVEQISKILQITTTILGLTVTAVATSLPELTVALLAAFKRDAQDNKVVVGTLIGSNIINLTLFSALVVLHSGRPVISMTEQLFLMLTTAVFSFLIASYKGTTITKFASLFLLVLFVVFILITFQYA